MKKGVLRRRLFRRADVPYVDFDGYKVRFVDTIFRPSKELDYGRFY
jgi:hypothetical protein